MADEPMIEDRMVAALLRERDAYVRQGKPDRVAQVDEQLALRGYSPPKDDTDDKSGSSDTGKGDDKPPASSKPQGRRAPAKRTT